MENELNGCFLLTIFYPFQTILNLQEDYPARTLSAIVSHLSPARERPFSSPIRLPADVRTACGIITDCAIDIKR
jgi:hypothetical protein